MSGTQTSENVLEMRGITKVYPNGIIANKDVNFSVRRGEIHALSGENGAGKTTLMKMLFGLEKIDGGEIYIKGKKIENISSPMDAIKNGVGMVHQHFMLVDDLTVAENMVMGMEPRKAGLFIDREKAVRMAEEISLKYNLAINPREKVRDLSVESKQKVEILKALLRGAEILILDEPTAVLTPQETEELFKELQAFKEAGHTIIFISHKLREIKELCDRITIIRAGKTMGTFRVADVSEQDISRLMVGRDVILSVDKEPAVPREVILSVRGLNYTDSAGVQVLKDVNLNLRRGQILGVAGVEGNGQSELIQAVVGLAHFRSGEIIFDGDAIRGKSIRQIREMGMAYIPQDRMTMGIAPNISIQDNLISDRYYRDDYSGRAFLKAQHIKRETEKLVDEFQVVCTDRLQSVGSLSGGNIQKVVVAREFSSTPKTVIAEQPTRGVDVGATEFIRRRIVSLRDAGAGVLLVSADLNEVLELSDSIIVMFGGEVAAYFPDSSQVTEEMLGLYMLGIQKMNPSEILF